jgi:hypothetical protein
MNIVRTMKIFRIDQNWNEGYSDTLNIGRKMKKNLAIFGIDKNWNEGYSDA